MTRNARNGFTLVELLVVTAIIGLLISILLPSLSRARAQANLVKCLSNLKQIGAASMMYATQNRGWLPVISPSQTNGRRNVMVANHWGYWMRHTSWVEPWHNLGHLYAGKYTDPRVFYCPTQDDPQRTYEYYTPWNGADSTNHPNQMRTGYIFNPMIRDPFNPGTRSAPIGMIRKFERITDFKGRQLLAIDMLFDLPSIPHRVGSGVYWNLLMTDYSAVSIIDAEAVDEIRMPNFSGDDYITYHNTLGRMIRKAN